jgi:hypothetical protein
VYRDDLEAAQARIAALESELAELREREADHERVKKLEAALVEARKAPVAAAVKPLPKPSDLGHPVKPKRDLTVLKTFLGLAGVVLGVAALFLIVNRVKNGPAKKLSPAELKSVAWVTTSAGDRLIASEEQTYRGQVELLSEYHLSALDPATGQVTARVEVPFALDYVGRTASGLWFRDYGKLGLHRRNDRTLAVEVTQADWLAKNPGLHVSEVVGVFGADGAIGLKDDQARFSLLDGERLEVHPAATRPGYGHVGFQVSSGSATEHSMTGAVWSRGERAALHCTGQPRSQETFLEPTFVGYDGGAAQPLDGGDVLAVYRESLGETPWILARVPCQGPARWTVPLHAPQIDAAFLSSGHVLVIARAQGAVARLLDLADGHEIWQHVF